MPSSPRIRTLPPYQGFIELKQFGPDPDDEAVFIEHPEDTLLTGSFPVQVKCAVKNALRLHIECAGGIRQDATQNATRLIHSLSLLIQRTEFDSSIQCRCVAFSKDTNNTVLSNTAIVRKSCRFWKRFN